MKAKENFENAIKLIIICLIIASCSKQKDNNIFVGYQKGEWENIDSTLSIKDIIFQDSIGTIIVTTDEIIGNPELYGKKNKSGVRSFFNYNVDPIELNLIYYNSEGKVTDTTKYFMQFIGKDTLQLTSNKGKIDESNYFNNSVEPVYTFIKKDTMSVLPDRISDITETINSLYSNFNFNIDDGKMPVYGNYIEINLGIAMFKASTIDYIFDAADIKILSLSENEATVSYRLIVTKDNGNSKEKPVKTKLKKINNEWRVYWKDIFGTKK